MKSARAILVGLLLFLAAALCLLAGCDQPPKVGGNRLPDKPSSVTADVATAGDGLKTVETLIAEIRDDANRLTAATAATLGPRIEQRADEAGDATRAVQATLAGVAAVSRENDKRLDAIVKEFERLQAANAKLAEQVEREKASAIRKIQLIVGGVSSLVIVAGVVLAVTGNIKIGALVGAAGVVGAGVAAYFATIAAVAGLASLVALLGGLAWLAWKYGWADDTIRRTIQAIEHAGKNAFASVKDVKAAIATATDDAMAAIVKEETRPAGK